jgi:hypothetical protein
MLLAIRLVIPNRRRTERNPPPKIEVRRTAPLLLGTCGEIGHAWTFVANLGVAMIGKAQRIL